MENVKDKPIEKKLSLEELKEKCFESSQKRLDKIKTKAR